MMVITICKMMFITLKLQYLWNLSKCSDDREELKLKIEADFAACLNFLDIPLIYGNGKLKVRTRKTAIWSRVTGVAGQ